MRRRKDFFGRDIGVAGDAVACLRGAALPGVAVGETDDEVGARAGIFEAREIHRSQPVLAAAELAIVFGPGGDRIVAIDAAGGEHRIGELAGRGLLVVAREHQLCPRRARVRNDVPVGIEIGDFFGRGLIGLRHRAVSAADLFGILGGEQHRVVAGDGEARGIFGEGLGDTLVEPAGGAIEAQVAAVAIAGERHVLVGKQCRHDARARLVGRGRNAARQRQRDDGRGHVEVLPLAEAEAGADGEVGELVELGGVDGRHGDSGR